MVTLSLVFHGILIDFDAFFVSTWRHKDSGNKYFRLSGRRAESSCSIYTLMNFRIDGSFEDAFDESLSVCDMLNYLLSLKYDGHSESEALQMTAVLYPDHFKYLDVLGFQPSSQEGGEKS